MTVLIPATPATAGRNSDPAPVLLPTSTRPAPGGDGRADQTSRRSARKHASSETRGQTDTEDCDLCRTDDPAAGPEGGWLAGSPSCLRQPFGDEPPSSPGRPD